MRPRKAQVGLTEWEAKKLLEIIRCYTATTDIYAESPEAQFLLVFIPRLKAIAKEIV